MSHLDFIRGLPEHELKAYLLIGDKPAEAYQWLMAYVDQVNAQQDYDEDSKYPNLSLDDLISAAMSHQGDKWGDYIVHGGRFDGFSTDPLFWKHLRILLDQPDLEEANFFSCSC